MSWPLVSAIVICLAVLFNIYEIFALTILLCFIGSLRLYWQTKIEVVFFTSLHLPAALNFRTFVINKIYRKPCSKLIKTKIVPRRGIPSLTTLILQFRGFGIQGGPQSCNG